MRRASTVVVVFLIFLNATAVLLESMGFTAALGIETSVQVSESLQNAIDAASNVSIQGGFLETLYGIYNAVGATFRTISEAMLAGPSMLNDVGVPTPITTFLWTGSAIIIGIDLIHILSGRNP